MKYEGLFNWYQKMLQEKSWMGKSITQKILEEHIIKGNFYPGEELAIKIDQTLTQDATFFDTS